jgi:hypothetical protein
LRPHARNDRDIVRNFSEFSCEVSWPSLNQHLPGGVRADYFTGCATKLNAILNFQFLELSPPLPQEVTDLICVHLHPQFV